MTYAPYGNQQQYQQLAQQDMRQMQQSRSTPDPRTQPGYTPPPQQSNTAPNYRTAGAGAGADAMRQELQQYNQMAQQRQPSYSGSGWGQGGGYSQRQQYQQMQQYNQMAQQRSPYPPTQGNWGQTAPTQQWRPYDMGPDPRLSMSGYLPPPRQSNPYEAQFVAQQQQQYMNMLRGWR